MLSKRVAAVHPSPTLAISAQAKAMRAEGVDVVALSAGEPDFPTPAHIVAAAHQALDDGDTRYGPAAGKPALRQAVARSLAARLGREIDWHETIIGVGAKQILFDAISCLVSEGDEVLLRAPYWVSFPDMVSFAGAELRVIETTAADGFVPAVADIRACINDRTGLLILNSPHNPTGTVLDAAWFESLAALLEEFPRVVVISDETYERLVYDGRRHVSLLDVAPGLAHRTLLVGSFSKAWAMTGWRLGFGWGPPELIEIMTRIAGASTSGPASFVQTAAIVALDGDQQAVEAMRDIFEQRRDLVCDLLEQIPNVQVVRPAGAFYVFIDVSHYLGRPDGPSTSQDLVTYLLEQHKLALVHGSAFGAEGYVRLSFAASNQDLERGIARLKAGLEAIA